MVESIDSTKARLDQLVNDYLDAKAAAEKAADTIKQRGEQIIQALPVGGRHEVVPGVGVRVQAPSMVFNADLARTVLTPEQYLTICESKPTATRFKFLPGALVDQCRVPGTKPSVWVL